MLLCVDQEKNIKVFRLNKAENGSTKRERIGVVAKKDFHIGDDFKGLSAEDTTELNNIISLYKQSSDVQRKAAALAFPETMRLVLEYLDAEGTDAERKHVFTALMEGVRHMRKVSGEG